MYLSSCQLFLKMWYSIPNTNAMSVPERMRTYSSAFAAVRVKRGSTTIIFAPVSFACSMCSIDTGCASAALLPMYSAHLVFCMSLYELVMAPSPQVLATPETVVEWQMRAWWSMLFVPKYETNLRSRYDCSLLCFELPTQNTASGPDSLRMPASLSPTSLIACSQLIFWYLPLTSFIGDFSRCSPWPCSRIDA